MDGLRIFPYLFFPFHCIERQLTPSTAGIYLFLLREALRNTETHSIRTSFYADYLLAVKQSLNIVWRQIFILWGALNKARAALVIYTPL